MNIVAWFVGIAVVLGGLVALAFKSAEEEEDGTAMLFFAVAVIVEGAAIWSLAAAFAR